MADPNELSVTDFFRFGRKAAEHSAQLASAYPAYAAAAARDDHAAAPQQDDERR